MHVQWFAHLPGVQLESGQSSYNILEGKVATLSFTEWSELDPSYPFSEGKYSVSQPVFYIGSAELEGDLKAVLSQVSERINKLYMALLLDSRVPLLPDPQLSVHYVRVNLQAGIATYRLVGPFEREWILSGNRIVYPFDAAAVHAFESVYELLSGRGNACSINGKGTMHGLDAGLETLARTARPDIWWDQRGVHHINDFVQCTAALENLLVPVAREAEDLRETPAFGQHAAVFVSKSRNGLEELAQSYAGLYRLRSKLVHGQMAMSDLSESDQQVLRLGRILLREVLLKTLALNKGLKHRKNGKTSLALMLKKAYKDEAYHQAIHEELRAVEALV